MVCDAVSSEKTEEGGLSGGGIAAIIIVVLVLVCILGIIYKPCMYTLA